jgi:lipopolysaccharide/colanic/teichoic acid biosynthesis glycosyltransferase
MSHQRKIVSALLKRIFDVCFAILGLVCLAPVILIACIAVGLSSGLPIFFNQERIGRNLKPFQIYKFRTMRISNKQNESQITSSDDRRITAIGSILRKSKIDEIPQLFNVLRGDMSFVGPRPEVPKYVKLYQNEFSEVLAVRPGITDLASIKYRNENELLANSENPEIEYIDTILPDKLSLAKEYVENQSLKNDLLLIFRTLLSLT